MGCGLWLTSASIVGLSLYCVHVGIGSGMIAAVQVGLIFEVLSFEGAASERLWVGWGAWGGVDVR